MSKLSKLETVAILNRLNDLVREHLSTEPNDPRKAEIKTQSRMRSVRGRVGWSSIGAGVATADLDLAFRAGGLSDDISEPQLVG